RMFKKAEAVMHKINIWLNHNELSLNVKKTKFIKFSLRCGENSYQRSIPIHSSQCGGLAPCNCLKIESADALKYLGVLIDKNLSWKQHVANIARKVRFGVCVLYKISHYANETFLKAIYYAFIQSHIQYCISAYGGCCA